MRLTDPKHKINKLINSRSLLAFFANSIRDLLLKRGASSEPTVVDYIEKYYANSVENNTSLSKGTKKNYVKANKHLKNFLAKNKMATLLVKQLTNSGAMTVRPN